MHIRDLLRQQQPCFSFEFFPPRTREGAEQLYKTMVDLVLLRPSYVSVTYGAGGSTRELTHGLIIRIREHTGLTVVSHMTCVGSTKADIEKILREYQEHGIDDIMALRGTHRKGRRRSGSLKGDSPTLPTSWRSSGGAFPPWVSVWPASPRGIRKRRTD